MKFLSRRLMSDTIRLVGRAWEDVFQELEEFLHNLQRQVEGGIPAGFNEVTPTNVDGTTPTTAGTELQGWAAADHRHALDISGVPGDVGGTNAQGSGPGVSLSGHTHALDWDTIAASDDFIDAVDARIEEAREPIDLRHYRRRRFLSLVDDGRLKGAVVGARRVFP